MTCRWGMPRLAPLRASTAGLAACLSLGMIACLGIAGCQPPSSPAASTKPAAPSKVTAPSKEADLATVVLTPEAETRIGVALAEVERKPMPRTTTYAGVVEVPPGRLIVVASPFNGTLSAPKGGTIPTPGRPVKQGQTILSLVPVLAPEAIAQMAPLLVAAEGQVKQATQQLNIAKVNLERSKELVRDRLGGSAALVDAQAQYDLADTNLRAAERNREILDRVTTNATKGNFNAQEITAPADGMLQSLRALPGQMVTAGTPLFDVASLDPVWVRTPVFVGDLAKLAADRDANICGLDEAPGAVTRRGKPIPAPPSGDFLNETVNIYYEVENKDGLLRTGERVGVILPMQGAEESLIVPYGALVRDYHGNAWVYEKTGDHAFSRRRVMVDRVNDGQAVLVAGNLKPGAKVVATGAAEIFGAEFGGFK